MATFAVKRKRAMLRSRRNHPSRFSYRGSEVKDQQTRIHSILHSSGAQAKLTVGQANDKYEREADNVSDKVMSMPDSAVQRQAVNEEEEETVQSKPLSDHVTPLVQRQEEVSEEEEAVQAKTYQNKGENSASIAPSSVENGINSIRGNGQALPVSTRKYLEPRFGANFKEVRVHTDSNANNLTRKINARAFTIGKDVVFGSGQYSPHTVTGRRLLAHELTHVLQQNSGRSVRRKLNTDKISIQVNSLPVIQRSKCLDMPVKINPYPFNFSVRNGTRNTSMLPSYKRYMGKIRATGLKGPLPREYFTFRLRRCIKQAGGRGNLVYSTAKLPKDNKYHSFSFINSVTGSHGLYGQVFSNSPGFTKGNGVIIMLSF